MRTEEDMREALQSLEDQILKNNEAITHMSKLMERWVIAKQSIRDQTAAAYEETKHEVKLARAERLQAIDDIDSRIKEFERKYNRLIAFNKVGAYQEPYPNG